MQLLCVCVCSEFKSFNNDELDESSVETSSFLRGRKTFYKIYIWMHVCGDLQLTRHVNGNASI